MRVLIITIIILTLNSLILAGDFEWWLKLRQIKPLQTTQKDVEKILGKSTDKNGSEVFYDIGENRVSISYSDGKCYKDERGSWDAPIGMVLGYDIFISTMLPAQDFTKFAKLNLKDFSIDTYKNINDVDTPSTLPFSYNSDKLGILLIGYKKGYKDEKGRLRAGKTVYLQGISIDPPENTKNTKCSIINFS